MSTGELISRARDGDPQAWRELYRAHAGRLVVWLSTRPTGDASVSADDLASEAWLIAAEKVQEFTGDADDFAAWLFGIARNVTINTQRRSARRRTEPSSDATTLDREVHDTSDLAAQESLKQALAQLPARERDVIGLVDGLGFDNAQAAEALGIKVVAVRVARHRGLAKLRRLYPERPD